MAKTSEILVAFGAGLAIGGLLGILFAPEKGSETREKIVDSGKKMVDKLKHNLKVGKEKMEEHMSKANDKVEEFT